MQVTRYSEAKPYEAPEHYDMRCLRLQGKEATVTDTIWIGLSHLLPGGRTSLKGAEAGVQLLRVHDVAETVQALKVWRGLRDQALVGR